MWANIWCAVLAVGWPDEKLVIQWPGPEVLLSRLSENRRIIPFGINLTALADSGNRLQQQAARLQLAVALQRTRVDLGRSNGQGFFGLEVLDQHAVDQMA